MSEKSKRVPQPMGLCHCVFRDARCRYVGYARTCSKTWLNCHALGNLINWRGYQEIPPP